MARPCASHLEYFSSRLRRASNKAPTRTGRATPRVRSTSPPQGPPEGRRSRKSLRRSLGGFSAEPARRGWHAVSRNLVSKSRAPAFFEFRMKITEQSYDMVTCFCVFQFFKNRHRIRFKNMDSIGDVVHLLQGLRGRAAVQHGCMPDLGPASNFRHRRRPCPILSNSTAAWPGRRGPPARADLVHFLHGLPPRAVVHNGCMPDLSPASKFRHRRQLCTEFGKSVCRLARSPGPARPCRLAAATTHTPQVATPGPSGSPRVAAGGRRPLPSRTRRHAHRRIAAAGRGATGGHGPSHALRDSGSSWRCEGWC